MLSKQESIYFGKYNYKISANVFLIRYSAKVLIYSRYQNSLNNKLKTKSYIKWNCFDYDRQTLLQKIRINVFKYGFVEILFANK